MKFKSNWEWLTQKIKQKDKNTVFFRMHDGNIRIGQKIVGKVLLKQM